LKTAAELNLDQVRHTVQVCACFNLRRAARTVTQIYDEALAPLGLSSGQFHLLLAVRLHGEARLQQLADTVSSDRSVLSRTVRPLVARRLLSMQTGRDRRTRAIALTAEGHRALVAGQACWQHAQARVVARLGEPLLGRLLGTLEGTLKSLTAPRKRARSARAREKSSI
jgi:DNA-binding MarR family transcriptional regulator